MTCFHARFAWLVACLLLAISVASAHEARVPEPSSFLLMGIGLLAGLWPAREQVFGHGVRCYSQ